MTYIEKETDRLKRRMERFLEFLASGPRATLAYEGALIIECVVALAGHEAMGRYAQYANMRRMTSDGPCPWHDGDDDPLNHPILDDRGMCAEHLAQSIGDQKGGETDGIEAEESGQ